jgi:hypothetical protein
MQVDARGREQIRSVANWMLAILCVLVIGAVVALFRLFDDVFEGVVILVLGAWVSVSAARAGYWLSRPLSSESLRRGLLGMRSFFRATLVSALINTALAVLSGGEFKWNPSREAAHDRLETGEDGGMSVALSERLEGLLVAMLSSCQEHTSDRCTEALFRAGSPVGAFKSVPDGFLRADVGRRCRQGNFARVEFEATYRGKGQGRLAAQFVRGLCGKWAFLALERPPSRSAPFECDEPPYHDVGAARASLEARDVNWSVTDGAHSLDLSRFWVHNCAIGKIALEMEGSSRTLDPGCWVEDGFAFGKEHSAIDLPSPAPSKVLLRVSFVDGSTSSWALSNPTGRQDGTSGRVEHIPSPSNPARDAGSAPSNRALVAGPDGARVWLDGEERCEVPCEIKVPVDGEEHEIRLKMDGFEDLVRSWKPTSVADRLGAFGVMEPVSEAEPEPEPEPEPEAASGSVSSVPRSYREAAGVMEPCWLMLTDDLPVRSSRRCLEAYKRVESLVGDARLLEVLTAAGEVGRAWNDADAGLSVRPAPGKAERRKIAKTKRSARRRERGLVVERTAAVAEFARKVMSEFEADGDCGRDLRLLLADLETLTVEFDAALSGSSFSMAEMTVANVHARKRLERANKSCASRGETASFREVAGDMISDAMDVGSARRSKTRCVKGEMGLVCAEVGGLGEHMRVVLFSAIRAGRAQG